MKMCSICGNPNQYCDCGEPLYPPDQVDEHLNALHLRELGLACRKEGITNPDAIPKMMDLLKRIQYHGDMKTHPVDYTQYAKDAQALLDELEKCDE